MHFSELHLERCDLKIIESTDNVVLNNLQTLRLHDVDITDEIFDKIISGCPLIENLYLSFCTGLKSIKFHKHHNIKDFSSSMTHQIIIEIENTHALENVHAEMFDNFSSFFSCLNELIINNCNGLKEFRLLSSSIKRLTIKMGPRNRIKAFIDTPNILYFKYSSDGEGVLPSIKFTTTSNEWKSKISLSYKLKPLGKDATSWFLKLNKLLKALSESHITLNLIHDEYKKLYINDSYGGFYKPVVVEHLKLWGCYSSYFVPAILNCFFKIFRPRYIQMENGLAKFNLAEYISKLIPYETGCYFWLQDLEEVSIEVMDMKAKEWRCLKGTILHALCSEKQIRFRLTWKEQ
ncbi:hypothetical protein CASFOL_021909 [Castilleja foliolosa]|uniref:F-box/LRR-repeat protein 15/At3g58940/PEG3-like LRR domain-containing protein n=1 Tax=Castilleja foliolosa TaxID=1961234 RepID=A0ABD3D1Q1_9LAMI